MRSLIFLALLALAGCARQSAETKAKTKGTLALSVMTRANPFFKVIGDAFTDEARQHGYSAIVVDGNNDVARQHDQVKDFLAQGVAAIALCPTNSLAIGPAIKEANDRAVPVFTADLACLAPGVQVVTHVATDNYQGGKQAGQALIEALGEVGGKVLILDFKAAESCILRVKGFREVIDAHNDKAKSGTIAIVSELPCDGKKELGYKATQDALEAHPDLAGIFAINDPSALGAVAALEKANKQSQVKIVAFDGQPEAKQAILEGKIYADPIQHPEQIGRKTVQAMVQYFRGETPPREILIETKLYRQSDAQREMTNAPMTHQ